MKKILLLLIFIITGCTQYNDLKELTIIKSIGINYEDNYHVYAQIIDSIDEQKNPKMKTIESNGKTITESFHNLEKLISKDVFLSHVDLLVLDKDLNSNNYQEIITYFINNNSFRNDFYCVFSSNVKKLLEQSKYDEIEIFLKTNNHKDIIKNFDTVIKEYIDNKTIILSNIDYHNGIKYSGKYQYNKKEF